MSEIFNLDTEHDVILPDGVEWSTTPEYNLALTLNKGPYRPFYNVSKWESLDVRVICRVFLTPLSILFNKLFMRYIYLFGKIGKTKNEKELVNAFNLKARFIYNITHQWLRTILILGYFPKSTNSIQKCFPS